MHAVFSQSGYVLKRQGLAISAKYRLYGSQNDTPLLFIEEKSQWIPPDVTTHAWTDEQKKQEILTLKQSDNKLFHTEVIDAETGQKIGGLGMAADTVSEIVKDAWHITDAEDKPIGKVFEKSMGQSILRQMLGNDLPQQMNITVGDTLVAELRQKVKMMSYELVIDFSMDAAHLLDRRLGIAAAIYVALHQGKET
ncbi:MAG: hypothetical protein HY868_02015 [Chloroflexi bacterium]|nr:hypothetical protein [Chloroflexota bacterium]